MQYEYTNSEFEWIGEHPKHWKLFRIGQRVESLVGGEWGSDPDATVSNDHKEIAVLRVSNFQDIYLNYDDITIRSVKTTKIPARIINSKCLLIEKSGGGEKQLVGRVVEAKNLPFDAITSNFIARIEFDCKVNTHFMNYVFHDLYSSDLNFPFIQQTTGIQNINTTYYLNIKVPFPPKPEQTAITDYLDNACTDIDRVVKIKQKQIENLQQQLKSIIHQTITKGLNPEVELKDSGIEWIGKMPKHWKIDRLKDLVKLRRKKTSKKSEIEDYLELEDLEKETGKIFGFRDTIEVSGKVTIFKKGDVLFGKLRPYLNKHYLAEKDGKCTGEILAFQCKRILNRYFEYCISSHGFIEKCTVFSYGAKMPRVDYNTQLATFYLPIPPQKEQDEISKVISKKKERALVAQSKIEKQIETILAYKKSLIHEVVTGKKQVCFSKQPEKILEST